MTRGCSSDTPHCTCLCCTLLNLHNCYQDIFARPCQMFPDYFQEKNARCTMLRAGCIERREAIQPACRDALLQALLVP